ncbi:MAG: hypothetical protein R3275_01410 [Saprospiraceae bacterium]|nr:hypothetical protein [Saprospiraceae bacterium]
MKKYFFLVSILALLTACDEECMVECDFTGAVQIDTTWPIPDMLWITGQDTVVFVYSNEDGDSLFMEVDQYEFSYSQMMDRVPCGECGDSVDALTVIPSFDYKLISNKDIEVSIQMNSGRVIEEEQRLLQCVDGVITFRNSNGTELGSTPFIFDCNSSFDDEDALKINKEAYGHKRSTRDTVFNTCVIDSGLFYFIDPAAAINEFTIAREVPIRMFNHLGTCWRFDSTRFK